VLPPVYTPQQLRRARPEPERLRPLVNSLWMSAVSTAAALGIALWAGRAIVRRRVALGRAIDLLTNVPWAVPARCSRSPSPPCFSVHAPLVGRWVLVGTFAILPLAYLVRNIPLTAGPVSRDSASWIPGWRKPPRHWRHRWATLRRVTIPLLRPALVACGALAFATAVSDFVTSVVLYTFETRPISIEISRPSGRATWASPRRSGSCS